MRVVEAHPVRVRVVEPEVAPGGGGAFIAATNHYRHPDMLALQRGRRLTHSQNRLAFLHRSAPHADDGSLLADHASRMCGHAGGHTTLWSLTADLTARTIAYARGAPCKTAYEAVPWPA
jgi:hypothetical protein